MSAQKNESFEVDVLIMGQRSSIGSVVTWFGSVIGLGLLVAGALELGANKYIVMAIYLPCLVLIFVRFIRSAMGANAKLSIRDGTLNAKRGRHKITVVLQTTATSWGRWTSSTEGGDARLSGPVLIFNYGNAETTTVGCMDPDLAVSLGAHLAPLVL